MNILRMKKLSKEIILPVLVAVIFIVGAAYAEWNEPTSSPPSGNKGAPINVEPGTQNKGDAAHDSDICVWKGGKQYCLSSITSSGGGSGIYEACLVSLSGVCPACAAGYRQTKCEGRGQVACAWGMVWTLQCGTCEPLTGPLVVNGRHTVAECSAAGGILDPASNSCQFSGGSCPSGWTKYNSWSTTVSNTCNGAHVGSCSGRTSCATGSHAWANIETETCSYKNETTGQTWIPTNYCQTDWGLAGCYTNDQLRCDAGIPGWCLDVNDNFLYCMVDYYGGYGCGSYSPYCTTSNATCAASVAKIGCY